MLTKSSQWTSLPLSKSILKTAGDTVIQSIISDLQAGVQGTQGVSGRVTALSATVAGLVTGVSSVNGMTGVVPLTGTASRITISASNVFDIGTSVVTLTGAQALTNKTGLISQWSNDSGYLTTISGIAAGGELAGTYVNPTLVNSAVIGKVLTGYISGAGTVAGTDNILQAIQKLNGNTAALITGVSSVNSLTGAVALTGTAARITVSAANVFDISASYVGQASITTLGTITTGVWTGTAIANANLANSAITINGTSVSLGGTRTLSLASSDFVNQGTVVTLLIGNAAGNPSFGAVNLATMVTGNLPVANLNSGTSAGATTFWRGDATWAVPTGGTSNISGGTVGAIPYQSGANTTTVLAATATANKILLSGASAAPVWSTPGFPNASATSLKLIRSDGTDWIASTSTFSDSPSTAGKVLISDGTNWITSTPTQPNAAGTVGQYLVSDGTNIVYGAGVGQAAITGLTGGINTTDTVIVQTGALAANRLQAGTCIEVEFMGTCTATAAAASTFSVRLGTLGTTSDATILTFGSANSATGTAVPFHVRLLITIRTAGASATSYGTVVWVNATTTGILSTVTQVTIPTTNTTFSTVTASQILSITYKTASANVASTFQIATIKFTYK